MSFVVFSIPKSIAHLSLDRWEELESSVDQIILCSNLDFVRLTMTSFFVGRALWSWRPLKYDSEGNPTSSRDARADRWSLYGKRISFILKSTVLKHLHLLKSPLAVFRSSSSDGWWWQRYQTHKTDLIFWLSATSQVYWFWWKWRDETIQMKVSY